MSRRWWGWCLRCGDGRWIGFVSSDVCRRCGCASFQVEAVADGVPPTGGVSGIGLLLRPTHGAERPGEPQMEMGL